MHSAQCTVHSAALFSSFIGWIKPVPVLSCITLPCAEYHLVQVSITLKYGQPMCVKDEPRIVYRYGMEPHIVIGLRAYILVS